MVYNAPKNANIGLNFTVFYLLPDAAHIRIFLENFFFSLLSKCTSVAQFMLLNVIYNAKKSAMQFHEIVIITML